MSQIDEFVVVADAEALAQHAAKWFAGLVEASSGPFAAALSGGSTPKRMYEILAADWRDRIDWNRVHLFFGDERLVPADSDRNNAHMARKALIEHIAIPQANVHPMPTEGDPTALAREYQATLQAYYRGDALAAAQPLFDVVFLGLGENGHTASLFPGTEVLENTLDWVSTCVPHDAPDTRMTLTYPAIASSREVAFLIAGEGKADVLAEIRDQDQRHPAARIRSVGRVNWFVDRDAAGEET